MASKRKSVRFKEDAEPSDKALLRMSKRRRDEPADNGEDGGAYGDIGRRLEPRPGEKSTPSDSKHTLDSDEEEEEKYERLNVEDVEGQEDATVEFDEETKITPFNMNDELEEGHFDSDGTFIFKKKSEDIRDAWLDNIDWAKIKKDAGGLWQGGVGESAELAASHSPVPIDRLSIYESILQYLQPKETITKALKRLGGSRTTSDVRKERWKERKSTKAVASDEAHQPAPECASDEPSASMETTAQLPLDEKAQAVMKLTELVDTLVDEGEFEVYGYTYERINHELEKLRKQKLAQQAHESGSDEKKPAAQDDSSALDMFADEIDVQKLQSKTTATTQPMEDKKEADGKPATDDVQWEFKWKNEDVAPVYGPYSSQQMQQWTDEDYFKDGVWVRRTGQPNTAFYSSKRIDFELYI